MIIFNELEDGATNIPSMPTEVYQEIFSYLKISKPTDNYEYQTFEAIRLAIHKYVEVNLGDCTTIQECEDEATRFATELGIPFIMNMSPIKLLMHRKVAHNISDTIYKHVYALLAMGIITITLGYGDENIGEPVICIEKNKTTFERTTARLVTRLHFGYSDFKHDNILCIMDFHGLLPSIEAAISDYNHDFRRMSQKPIAHWGWPTLKDYNLLNNARAIVYLGIHRDFNLVDEAYHVINGCN